MPRRFTYFLVTEDHRFYYTNPDNSVSFATTPTPLKYTPDGWLDIEIQRQRNLDFFAMERTFTTPLDFVKDGGTIIKYHFYKYGTEAKLYLAIGDERLYIDDTTYGLYYSLLYKGEIDFSQFVHSGPKVTLNIMEGGAAKLVKAYQTTQYDISMDGAIAVKFDGVKLQQKANWIATGLKQDNHTLGMTFISQEAITSIGAESQDTFGVSNQLPDIWNSNQYFLLIGSKDTPIKLTWDFIAVADTGSPPAHDNDTSLQLQLIILKDISTVIYRQTIQEFTGHGAFFGAAQHFQGTMSFTAPAGCRVILYMNILHNSDAIFVEYRQNDNSLITAEYTYSRDYSYIKALRPLDLFQKICAKMGITVANSNILNTYAHYVLTTGDLLRRIDSYTNPVTGVITDTKMKTSLADFFQSFNSILSLGLSATPEGLALELKSSFVDYSNPIKLGECVKLVLKVATDYMFSTMKIGYPTQTYDDVNGKYEFNNTMVFTSEQTRVSKELNLVSVYRGDCYGATFAWLNLEKKTTTDSGADNEVFILVINKRTEEGQNLLFDSWALDRYLNPYVSGHPEPETIFNLDITPKRNLMRHGRYLHSCFYLMDNTSLKFQSTDKWGDLVVSEPNKSPVVEKADVAVSALGDRLFIPLSLEFENKNPYEILDILRASPLRCYQTTIEGVAYTGLPLADSVKPGNDEIQTFKLLLKPDTNVEPLIMYDGD